MTTATSTYDHGDSRMTIPTDDARGAYWDQYYSKLTDTARPLPSQFAVFVASELQSPHRVVEFGCGSGRDSLLFSSLGYQVIGVDASDPAINRCRRLVETLGETADFLTSSIDDPNLLGGIPSSGGPTAIYARFFLRAHHDRTERARAKPLRHTQDRRNPTPCWHGNRDTLRPPCRLIGQVLGMRSAVE